MSDSFIRFLITCVLIILICISLIVAATAIRNAGKASHPNPSPHGLPVYSAHGDYNFDV